MVLKIVEGNIDTDLAITPSASALTGGGELTLTVSGLPDAGAITVTCNRAVTVRETGTRGVYTVTLPDEDAAYTFTASYSGSGSYQSADAACTVTVTKGTSPSGGGGGGGASDKPPAKPADPTTTTETKTNADGGTTTTVTDHTTGIVTVTITDPEGGKSEKVVVPGETVTVTVTAPDGETWARLELPAVIPEPEQKFTDVPENHWAEQGIRDMAALGVIQGVGNGRYDMNADIKRADLATMLFRLSNGTGGHALQFSDVPSDKYYAQSVAWASKVGVVQGNGNG